MIISVRFLFECVIGQVPRRCQEKPFLRTVGSWNRRHLTDIAPGIPPQLEQRAGTSPYSMHAKIKHSFALNPY